MAGGDHTARVPREGPEELRDLADSFNQMAASIGEQEQIRRDFIANAAHELRTPLTNLQGYLEAMRDGVIVADRRDLRLAVGGGRSTWCGCRDRSTPWPKATPDEPATTLERSICRRPSDGGRSRRSRQSSGPGCTSTTDIPDGLLARANPDHLAQVLANLLSNAVRYTPTGGSIAVRAERRPADLLVSVTNTGEGIPPTDLGRVFERFYRVEKSRDRAQGGAGIGLAIVKQLVEAAGGRVGAESSDGKTRFWFSLPERCRPRFVMA